MTIQKIQDQVQESKSQHPKHADGTPNCEKCTGDGSCAKINIVPFSNIMELIQDIQPFKKND